MPRSVSPPPSARLCRRVLLAFKRVNEHEVFHLPGPLDLTGLWTIVSLDRDDLKQPRFVSETPKRLADVESSSPPDVLAAVRERDVLLHHPYDSFSTSVQLFLE